MKRGVDDFVPKPDRIISILAGDLPCVAFVDFFPMPEGIEEGKLI